MRKATSLSASEIFNPSARSALNERHIDAKDAKRYQLVGVEIAEMLILHLPRKFQADIHYRHGELLLVVILLIINGEAERLHLARVIRIWLEMKNAGPSPSLRNPSHSILPASRVMVK